MESQSPKPEPTPVLEAQEPNNSLNIRSAVEHYLPYLVLAGNYALRIQSQVHSLDLKQVEGATQFTQALTDADLSVQNMVEIATLAKYPNVAFEPEEADRSINLKYFPRHADTLLTLDPINGTKFYKDGLPLFEIILTILEKGQIVGSVNYVPAKNTAYIGIKGHGAFRATDEDILQKRPWQELKLQSGTGKILMYRCSPAMAGCLGKTFELKDMDRGYDPAHWDVSLHSVLSGDLDAYVKQKAQLIDWGSTAFIIEQAGGSVTDFDGKPLPNFLDYPDRRIPSIIAAVNKDINCAIIKALAEANAE